MNPSIRTRVSVAPLRLVLASWTRRLSNRILHGRFTFLTEEMDSMSQNLFKYVVAREYLNKPRDDISGRR